MAARAQSVRRSAAPKTTASKTTAPRIGGSKAAARTSPAAKPAAANSRGAKPGTSARAKKAAATKAPPRQALAKPSPATKKVATRPAPAPTPTISRGKPVPQTKNKASRVSLGRPKVVGEELLDLVFKEDFHARQIFVFLGVRTVRELEDFGPQQILDKAAEPLKQTVDRIRRRLALLNRALRDDQEFAVKFLERFASESTP